MIVDSAVYRNGERLNVDSPHEDCAAVRNAAQPGDFVWVGMFEPTAEEMKTVAATFGLHVLAVEDAVVAHQRPKVDTYDQHLHMVLKTLWYVDDADAVETGEISLFVGTDFVITVRHGDGVPLDTTRHELEEKVAVMAHGPSAVAYAVCDTVVDTYVQVVEELQTDVEEVEESVFSPQRSRDSARIYALKREIAEVRRAVMPLREPVRRLAGGAVEGISDKAAPFFKDVLDHLVQAAEHVDGLDQLLSAAFEAHLASISVQQNDDMRKISAGAALVVVPTLIAGVYGMNFTHMPELQWSYGYPMAIGLMVSAAAVLWWFFKKSGWL